MASPGPLQPPRATALAASIRPAAGPEGGDPTTAPVLPPAPSLSRFAWLSIAAAVATITLKGLAWRLTGSVGLLSDALESLVNLVAAILTLLMLGVAARPPDVDHAYGHTKAEYFSSGAEGALILLAAAGIAWTALGRLLAPQPLEAVGLGAAVSTAASLVNLAVGRVLLAAGRRYHSIALEADARHLMTDVWTSAGVLAAIGLVALTGWTILDPIIAILVAVQIVWTGGQLLRRSALGLLDTALAGSELEALRGVLARHEKPEVRFHAVRTRQAGARRFISMHVLVPGEWPVRRGHALLEEIEQEVRLAIPNATVLTHLEALEDPASWQDEGLDRASPPPV
jgi:cation diffusion facilitator family transporter